MTVIEDVMYPVEEIEELPEPQTADDEVADMSYSAYLDSNHIHVNPYGDVSNTPYIS